MIEDEIFEFASKLMPGKRSVQVISPGLSAPPLNLFVTVDGTQRPGAEYGDAVAVYHGHKECDRAQMDLTARLHPEAVMAIAAVIAAAREAERYPEVLADALTELDKH